MKTIETFLDRLFYEIINEAVSQGRMGSGGIANSLEVKVEGESHQLLGWRWINEAWESGRGPTENTGGDGAVKRGVARWVSEQNITPRDDISIKSMIYLITRSIHEKGSLLFQQGGHSGVLSHSINEAALNRLSKEVLISYSSDVFKELQKL